MASRLLLAAALALTFAMVGGGPTAAQTEVFHAVSVNDQGARFTLVVSKTGTRLTFVITARSAQTSLSGSPRCDAADLRPDGTFQTYCGGFQAQEGGRTRMQGNLVSARLDTVFRFGSAEFKFTPGPLPSSASR